MWAAAQYGALGKRSQSSSLDSATTAWVAAVVGAGGTVSGGRQTTVNNLIVSLKADGIWAKLDRLWVTAAENTQSALIDLVALDVASAVNSPTFTTDRGYAGDAATSYIDTTFNASTQGVNFTFHNSHMAVWDNTSRAAATTIQTGAYDGTTVTDLFVYQAVFANTGIAVRNSMAAADVGAFTNSLSIGLFVGQANNSSTQEAFYNGSSLGTQPITFPGAGLINLPFFVCGRNDGGSLSTPTSDQMSMVSYGAALSGTEAGNYYTRLRTYMTAVGVP